MCSSDLKEVGGSPRQGSGGAVGVGAKKGPNPIGNRQSPQVRHHGVNVKAGRGAAQGQLIAIAIEGAIQRRYHGHVGADGGIGTEHDGARIREAKCIGRQRLTVYPRARQGQS